MARSSDSNFLKSLLRDKTFQAKEIRRIVKLGMLYLAITTVVVGVLYQMLLSKLFSGASPLLFVAEDMLRADESLPSVGLLLGLWVLGMLLVNTLISVALGIYLTRKLGHPLMAIKRALREIGNGNLYVRLRASDKDEFGELSAELNKAMHKIRTQVESAQKAVANIEATQKKPESETLELQNDSLNVALGDCRSALEFFHVDEPIEYVDLVSSDVIKDNKDDRDDKAA